MTTIAWDGQALAADTLTTWGDTRDGTVIKIARRGPFLAAASGKVTPSQAFLDWFRTGLDGDGPDMLDGDEATFGFVFGHGGLVLMFGANGWSRFYADRYAAGSGAELALGALAVGATAEQAVRAAAQYDIKTGGEITVLSRTMGI